MTVESLLRQSAQDCMNAVQQLSQPHAIHFMAKFAETLAHGYHNGKKVLIAGNGGSLCDAAHFAEELTGYFRKPRKALAAIALTDPAHITCTANDTSFECIFSRAIEALAHPGDIFVGLTTSGNSPNILRALEAAQERELTTVLFLGKGGGKLKGLADLELIINGFETSDRIQEAHMAAIHMTIEALESLLFSPYNLMAGLRQ